MPDLVEWLETAISERERAALAASYWPDDPECSDWPYTFQHSSWRRQYVDEREMTNDVITSEGARRHSVAVVHAVGDSQMPRYLSHHIALNDPNTVLRRCAADRKILAAVRRGIEGHPGPCVNYEDQDPRHYSEYEPCERHIRWSDATLPLRAARLLAEGYGYQEAANHG